MAGIHDHFQFLSASNLNSFIEYRSRFYMKYIAKIKDTYSPDMFRGNAVEHAVTYMLTQEGPIEIATSMALKEYDEATADLDVDEVAECRVGIPGLIQPLVDAIKPLGKIVGVQRRVEGYLPGLPDVLMRGYVDLIAHPLNGEPVNVDIKIKAKSVSGGIMPMSWGRQGGVYTAITGAPTKFFLGVPLKKEVKVSSFDVNETNASIYIAQLVEAAKAMDMILKLPAESWPAIFLPNPEDWIFNEELTRNNAKAIWPIADIGNLKDAPSTKQQ